MTFLDQETSIFGGAPIELYSFRRGDFYWRYTSSDSEKTVGGYTYGTAAIDRSGFIRIQDTEKSQLKLTTPANLSVLQQFIQAPPSDIIYLDVYKYHETDPDEEVITEWSGRVTDVKFTEFKAEIICEPLFTSLKRTTLRRYYQKSCPHVLYGDSCGVDKTLYLVSSLVDSFSGVDITSTTIGGYDDGYFAGGYIERDATVGSTNFDKRFIRSHVGDTITLNIPIPDLEVGETISIYPGCLHTVDSCDTKFNNYANYGGFPYIPDVNPMGGESIF